MNNNVYKLLAKYRKYLISFQMEAILFYALWGTDLKDQDLDKFLINSKGQILLFRTKEALLHYLKIADLNCFKDKENISGWAAKYKYSFPCDAFNIDTIENIFHRLSFSLGELSKDEADLLLNFYNLFGDYARQINTASLYKIIEEPNMKIFFDFYYNTYFWSSPEEGYDPDKKIDIIKFKKNFVHLVTTFKKLTHIIE